MKEFKNFDSAKISWFRCGGKIDVFCIIENIEELKEVLKKYKDYKNNILPVGNGSNLLIRDKGFNGLAIKLAGDFNKIKLLNTNKIVAGSGCSLKSVCDFAIKNNLIGCEFLSTIPGSVGGGLKMNAGCFESEIKDIFESARVLVDGNIKELTANDLNFSYRKTNLQKNTIILDATFKLKKTTNENEIETSKQKIYNMQKHRQENQIIGATCGSTFANYVDKNGNKISVWKMIDEVGLRGYTIGGAKFSEKHCNFIVNFNKATASDVENLINLAKQKIKDKFNIDIFTEIQII